MQNEREPLRAHKLHKNETKQRTYANTEIGTNNYIFCRCNLRDFIEKVERKNNVSFV